ncbi:hypothetical protein R1flu_027341 [Riccia fluitans]|uniref:Uncharacterized protein n=1 Tax=Riccia fluitans TaxID=41844 RepID=A0ABD1XII0_9MARC
MAVQEPVFYEVVTGTYSSVFVVRRNPRCKTAIERKGERESAGAPAKGRDAAAAIKGSAVKRMFKVKSTLNVETA